MRTYYNACEKCGANLDPGEICDCEKGENMNIHEMLEKGIPKLKDHEWDKDKLHISDLGTVIDGCPRQLWLRLHGAKERPLHLGELLMFDAGQRIHDRMVEALKLGGCDVIDSEKETELDGLTGRYDIKIRDGKQIIIGDFKTVRGAAFGHLTEPKPSNVLQVLGYLKAENADKGMLIYIDREGQNGIRTFEIERCDEAIDEAVKTLKNIQNGDEPPILKPILDIVERKQFSTLYVKQPWNCNYCKYCDVSCQGALSYDLRANEIAGRIKDGEYEPENEKYTEIVKELLNNE